MLRQLFQHFTKPVSQEFCENWAILDQDRLVNYARLQAGSAADAELVLSKSLHRVMRALYEGRVDKDKLLSYAYTAIRNTAASLHLKEANRRAAEQHYAQHSAMHAELAPAPDTAAAGKLDLRHALQQLPAELGELVLLHIWDERTFADIAAARGVSESSVRRQYRVALDTIRTHLDS